MRPRTLLILLLVVVGLVAFIALYEGELPSSDERAAQAKLLFHFDDEDVNGLEIEWEGNRVVLERPVAEAADEEGEEESRSEVTDEWRLVYPLEARADGLQSQCSYHAHCQGRRYAPPNASLPVHVAGPFQIAQLYAHDQGRLQPLSERYQKRC